jgi:hypothetical protein
MSSGCPAKIPRQPPVSLLSQNSSELVTLRIEADSFNVLNRSCYGTLDDLVGDAPAGSFNNFSLAPPPGATR